VYVKITVVSNNVPQGFGENHEKYVRIANLLEAEILTWYLKHTRREYCSPRGITLGWGGPPRS